mmetsp:Transcript_20296/g.53051  ORF Transcript_20296/g.53051 Transcript_20296/m.53051 type:complete len:657 (-) Transcript_20296:619-2589(-)
MLAEVQRVLAQARSWHRERDVVQQRHLLVSHPLAVRLGHLPALQLLVGHLQGHAGRDARQLPENHLQVVPPDGAHKHLPVGRGAGDGERAVPRVAQNGLQVLHPVHLLDEDDGGLHDQGDGEEIGRHGGVGVAVQEGHALDLHQAVVQRVRAHVGQRLGDQDRHQHGRQQADVVGDLHHDDAEGHGQPGDAAHEGARAHERKGPGVDPRPGRVGGEVVGGGGQRVAVAHHRVRGGQPHQPAGASADDEHGDKQAGGDGAAGGDDGHEEVDDQHGGHGGPAKLEVGAPGEEVPDGVLARHAHQGGQLVVAGGAHRVVALRPVRGKVRPRVVAVAGVQLHARLHDALHVGAHVRGARDLLCRLVHKAAGAVALEEEREEGAERAVDEHDEDGLQHAVERLVRARQRRAQARDLDVEHGEEDGKAATHDADDHRRQQVHRVRRDLRLHLKRDCRGAALKEAEVAALQDGALRRAQEVDAEEGGHAGEEHLPRERHRPVRRDLLKRKQKAAHGRAERDGHAHRHARCHKVAQVPAVAEALEEAGHAAQRGGLALRQRGANDGADVDHGPLRADGHPGPHCRGARQKLHNERAQVEDLGDGDAVEEGHALRHARAAGRGRHVHHERGGEEDEEAAHGHAEHVREGHVVLAQHDARDVVLEV